MRIIEQGHDPSANVSFAVIGKMEHAHHKADPKRVYIKTRLPRLSLSNLQIIENKIPKAHLPDRGPECVKNLTPMQRYHACHYNYTKQGKLKSPIC